VAQKSESEPIRYLRILENEPKLKARWIKVKEEISNEVALLKALSDELINFKVFRSFLRLIKISQQKL
jgi:hypothetical protein